MIDARMEKFNNSDNLDDEEYYEELAAELEQMFDELTDE